MNVHSQRFRSATLRNSSDALEIGWFSLGLGTAEIVAPRLLIRTLGMEGHERLVQSYGLREIASGAGILATHGPNRAPRMWGRMGGGLLDIATVSEALNLPHAPRARMHVYDEPGRKRRELNGRPVAEPSSNAKPQGKVIL